MSIYMSRAELEEISEGLITAYANKFSNRVIQSIDIEHFITEFLMLRIEYASFAEDDAGRIGFLADGATPLLIHQDGKIIPFVFPKDTIVLDKFLLAEKEQGRRRFTMAHEASHHILSKMYAMPSEGRFHAEYDSERSYSKEELAQMFASVEWQADTMGASLLMPRRIIENALAKYNQSNPIRVYGDNTITSKDIWRLFEMKKILSVFLMSFIVFALSACNADVVKIEDYEWEMRTVMSNDTESAQYQDELVVAVGEADELYPDAEIVDMTLTANIHNGKFHSTFERSYT